MRTSWEFRSDREVLEDLVLAGHFKGPVAPPVPQPPSWLQLIPRLRWNKRWKERERRLGLRRDRSAG